MKNRVLESARLLEYQPRLVARPGVIGILVRDEAVARNKDLHAFGVHLFHAAARRNYFLEIIPLDMTHLLVQHLVDGVVEVELGTRELMRIPNLPKIPVVLTQGRNPYPHWSSVCVDYEQEARLALETLLLAGQEHIAVLMDCTDCLASNCRKKVIREILSGNPGSGRMVKIFNCADKHPCQILDEVLAGPYTALLNFMTCWTGRLLDVLLNEKKIRIPEDLSVLMLDNSGICGQYHPKISYLHQPVEAVAQTAIEELVRLIGGQEPRKNLLFQSEYVELSSIRRSS